MRKDKGISLIVLVITIIVIIILAGAVILSLVNNNPIAQATEATFKSDISSYNSELSLYIADQMAKNSGNYNTHLLNAFTPTDVKNVIKSMSDSDAAKFQIVNGKLVTISTASSNDIKWASESGIGKQDYLKGDLLINIDGYDAPQNVSGTYYWMDRSEYRNDLQMSNFANPANSTTSGYDSSSKSYAFDGVDDSMLSIADIPNTKNQYTMEIIFKPTIYKYVTLGTTRVHLKWRIAGQHPYMNYYDTLGNPNSTSFNTTPVLNAIYNFSTTYDGNTSKLYINNQEYNSVNQTFTVNSLLKLMLSNATEKIQGNVYAVRIYNRVLSTQELNYNYNLDVQRFGII